MTSHLPRLLFSILAAVTLVLSMGGAAGLWPTGAPPSPQQGSAPAADGAGVAVHPTGPLTPAAQVVRPEPEGTAVRPQTVVPAPGDPPSTMLPARSGHGRRAVFDMSRQRVWLVGPAGRVRRTYLVSGSRHDNLGPGHYDVDSKSMHAVSYTYEETMRYMVRFTEGDEATIGFHDIPVDQQGRPVQSRAQLGRPLSSGCIRQARPDARAMWRFADVGTEVVVVR